MTRSGFNHPGWISNNGNVRREGITEDGVKTDVSEHFTNLARAGAPPGISISWAYEIHEQ
jgi:hypothetical protein